MGTEIIKKYDPTDISVGVRTVHIGLKRVGDTNIKSHISGMEKIEHMANGKSGMLKSIFLDLLSSLKIPTSTIDTMLGKVSGSVNKLEDSDEQSVTIKATSGTMNLDSEGFPVVFQLAPSGSGGAQNYKYYAKLTYSVVLRSPKNGTLTFYPNTEQTSLTYSLTVK